MPGANRYYMPGYVLHIAHRRKKSFLQKLVEIGVFGTNRKIVGSKKSYELREPVVPYGVNFTLENGLLRLQDGYFWDAFVEISTR